MAIFNMVGAGGGGGGAGLNFRTYLTSEMPANPKENDIRITSTTPIGKTTLDVTQPYNFFKTTKTSATAHGITATANDDGSITANGTATQNVGFDSFGVVLGMSAGSYFLSGCPSGGSASTYYMSWYYSSDGSNYVAALDYGDGVAVTIAANTSLFFYLEFNSGVVADNLTFYPQIEAGAAKTAYYPARGISEGDVFIQNNTSSSVSFNASADENYVLQEYPGQVLQYQNGAWVMLSAEIYKGGEWVHFSVAVAYLYNAGDECTALTGGWTNSGYISLNGNALTAATKNTGYITVNPPPPFPIVYMGFGTENSISLTAYSKLTLSGVTRSTSGTNYWIAALPTKSTVPSQGAAVYTQSDATLAAGAIQWDVDITSLSGDYFISFGGYLSNYDTAKVYLT